MKTIIALFLSLIALTAHAQCPSTYSTCAPLVEQQLGVVDEAGKGFGRGFARSGNRSIGVTYYPARYSFILQAPATVTIDVAVSQGYRIRLGVSGKLGTAPLIDTTPGHKGLEAALPPGNYVLEVTAAISGPTGVANYQGWINANPD